MAHLIHDASDYDLRPRQHREPVQEESPPTPDDVAWQIYSREMAPAIGSVLTTVLQIEATAAKVGDEATAEVARKMLAIHREAFELVNQRVREEFPTVSQRQAELTATLAGQGLTEDAE